MTMIKNRPIIPPPYCNNVLLQRNDDSSVFCDDFQFGSPDTDKLFVPSNIIKYICDNCR